MTAITVTGLQPAPPARKNASVVTEAFSGDVWVVKPTGASGAPYFLLSGQLFMPNSV